MSTITYDSFMKEYNKQHMCCPKCGAESHMTTLAGYVLNLDKPEAYKNLNRCDCIACGDVHTAHERVPKKPYNLFLDDHRVPEDCLSYMHNWIGPKNTELYLHTEWVIVRSYEEFMNHIIMF